jgi:hypothetical protein
VRADTVGDLLAEQIPFPEDMPAARDEPTAVAVDVRKCAKAVVFQLEHALSVVECQPDWRSLTNNRNGY